jgi:hypothetical protein
MAQRPIIMYPLQVASGDPGYPHGKAQNVTVPGDGTGTPLEQGLVNELFGFQQALLDEAGITPNGAPEQVGASQYVDAVKAVADERATGLFDERVSNIEDTLYFYAAFGVVDAARDNGGTWALNTIYDSDNNFDVSGNAVRVPSTGRYEVTISGHVKSSDSTADVVLDIWVAVNGSHSSPAFVVTAARPGSSTGQRSSFSRTFLLRITDPAHQRLSVQSGTNGASLQDTQLIIRRVG